MSTQYKKGVLELCVLSLLHKRDCYGYEIADFLSERIEIADGTVYPILRKLKSDGLLTTYLQEESGLADLFAFLSFMLLAAWGVVMGAASLSCAALAVCLLGG